MRTWTPPSPLPGPLETARTIIRLYQKGDGPRLYAAVNACRDLLWLWLPWATSDHADIDDSIFFVEKVMRRSREPDCRDFPVAVFDRDGATFLGGLGFHRIVAQESTAEVGYWIRGDRHGEGLCTEAAAAFITAGLTPQADGGWGFRRITLLCAADNIASSRVANKLGMRLERRERAERYSEHAPTPGYLDSLGFAVLASEWDFETQRAKPAIAWPPSA